MGENIRRKKMSFHCHFRKISFHVISGKENVFSLSFHENLISFPFISCHFRKRKTEKEKEKEGEQYLCRVEICRDRHDQQSCKICASCVNFPGKQRDFSHNL